MIKVLFLVLLAESWIAAGHVFLKKGTNALGSPDLKNIPSYLGFSKKILRMPVIWLGILFMAVGLLVWLMALSRFHLNVVFSLGSMQYILTLIASRIFLDEKIDSMKLAGTLLVVGGIVVIALT